MTPVAFTLYLYVNLWDLILIFFSLGAPIPTSHFSSRSLAPFSEHPHRYRVLESPLQEGQPRSTFPGYPYPCSSGISTDGLTPPVHPGYLPLRGMQDPPQQRVQPQNTMPCDLKFRSHLHARDPGICSPTWNARSASSWIATTKYDVR